MTAKTGGGRETKAHTHVERLAVMERKTLPQDRSFQQAATDIPRGINIRNFPDPKKEKTRTDCRETYLANQTLMMNEMF
jgi:hypothetical protein